MILKVNTLINHFQIPNSIFLNLILIMRRIFLLFAIVTVYIVYCKDERDSTTLRGFTLEELRTYDGIQKPQVYLALKGMVFDVSASEFYKKPSQYAHFAGRDVTRATALWSLEEKDLDGPIDDLTPNQVR